MERSYLLFAGALSGLVSLLAHAVVWSIAEMIQPRMRVANIANRQLDVPDVLLHLLAGTGLGLLFWLSWGLAGIVEVPWWWRGLAFGGLTSLTLAVPAVIGLARARAIGAGPILVIATRWITTCVIAGLACAWSWDNRL